MFVKMKKKKPKIEWKQVKILWRIFNCDGINWIDWDLLEEMKIGCYLRSKKIRRHIWWESFYWFTIVGRCSGSSYDRLTCLVKRLNGFALRSIPTIPHYSVTQQPSLSLCLSVCLSVSLIRCDQPPRFPSRAPAGFTPTAGTALHRLYRFLSHTPYRIHPRARAVPASSSSIWWIIAFEISSKNSII